MKALTRILGTVAAVTAGAVAAYAVGKVLAKESNTYAQLAHETADPAEPLSKAPEAVQQAAAALTDEEQSEQPVEPQQPAAAPSAPEQPAEQAAAPVGSGAIRWVEQTPAEDAPNPNPVDAAPAVAPRTADGKIDVTKLIDPADFADWDELGCKS